jgi:hypothetical protein
MLHDLQVMELEDWRPSDDVPQTEPPYRKITVDSFDNTLVAHVIESDAVF